MDLSQLKTLNDAAVATFEELSQRQRYRKDTNLRRFRKALSEKHGNIDLHQLEEVFRHMEQLGLGSLVIGRDDKPTRFVWKYNLKDVAKAAETGVMPDRMLGGKKPKVDIKKAPASIITNKTPKTDTADANIFIIDGGNLSQYRVTPANTAVVKALLDSLCQK